jgi:hypothetical protein
LKNCECDYMLEVFTFQDLNIRPEGLDKIGWANKAFSLKYYFQSCWRTSCYFFNGFSEVSVITSPTSPTSSNQTLSHWTSIYPQHALKLILINPQQVLMYFQINSSLLINNSSTSSILFINLLSLSAIEEDYTQLDTQMT